MCGRYTLTVEEKELNKEFEAIVFGPLQPRYNLAPTQLAPVVRMTADGGQRQLAMHRWGLIPSWAKDSSIGNRMINARAETAADKPAFRTALKRQRCLVPCNGFYEWKVLNPDAKKPTKQPHYIRRSDERLMTLAGLWERWRATAAGSQFGSASAANATRNKSVATSRSFPPRKSTVSRYVARPQFG